MAGVQLETMEVALIPSGHFAIINAKDFDKAKHVRWAERDIATSPAEPPGPPPKPTIETAADITREALEQLTLGEMRELGGTMFGAKIGGTSKDAAITQLLALAEQAG